MVEEFCMRATIAAILAGAFMIAAFAANADTIIDEWNSIKAPPPPQLKPVQIAPRTTALLMMDFVARNCGERPRCLATMPAVAKFLGQARASGMLIIYTT